MNVNETQRKPFEASTRGLNMYLVLKLVIQDYEWSAKMTVTAISVLALFNVDQRYGSDKLFQNDNR